MSLTILIPISYNKTKDSKISTSIVDPSTVKVNVIYNEKTLRTNIYQNEIILLSDTIEKSSSLIYAAENLRMSEYQWKQEIIKNDDIVFNERKHKFLKICLTFANNLKIVKTLIIK